MGDSEVNLSELSSKCLDLYEYDILFKRKGSYTTFIYQYINLYLVIHGIRNACFYSEYLEVFSKSDELQTNNKGQIVATLLSTRVPKIIHGKHNNTIPYINVPYVIEDVCKSIHLQVKEYNSLEIVKNYFIFKATAENMELYKQISSLELKDSHEFVGRLIGYLTPFNIKTKIRTSNDKQGYININLNIEDKETELYILPQVIVDKSDAEIEEYYLPYLNFINENIEILNSLFSHNKLPIIIHSLNIVIKSLVKAGGFYSYKTKNIKRNKCRNGNKCRKGNKNTKKIKNKK
jgi:hypothetical protein